MHRLVIRLTISEPPWFFLSEPRTIIWNIWFQALSERSAEKKIRRMLFPRYQRKSVKTSTEDESQPVS
jgi:hypothetical protein